MHITGAWRPMWYLNAWKGEKYKIFSGKLNPYHSKWPNWFRGRQNQCSFFVQIKSSLWHYSLQFWLYWEKRFSVSHLQTADSSSNFELILADFQRREVPVQYHKWGTHLILSLLCLVSGRGAAEEQQFVTQMKDVCCVKDQIVETGCCF